MNWVRRNVWDLAADSSDETLKWYGQAVAAMKARPIDDGRSWMFQAAVHGHPGWNNPPQPWAGVARAVRRKFWNQCQHATWYFLPWHRMYLGYFEQIVRAEVVALGGPESWALPYWNYNRGDESRILPPRFRARVVDGQPNPLFVEARTVSANLGDPFMRSSDVDLAPMLAEEIFFTPPGDSGTSFAGPKTPFAHSGPAFGALESKPHNFVHVRVSGWMGNPDTAALDPIFWLHHANIDRLWEAWLQSDPEHENTNDPAWTRDVEFAFRNANDAEVELAVAAVLDSASSPFQYTYDQPAPVVSTAVAGGRASVAASESSMARKVPELRASSDGRVVVSNDPVTVPVHRETRKGVTGRAAAQAPSRVFLSFEAITCQTEAGIFDVYLDVPEQGNPVEHPDHLVGSLALFGIEKASDPKGPHGGAGMSQTIDITDQAVALGLTGGTSDEVRVSLVRSGDPLDGDVRIGRVSIYES